MEFILQKKLTRFRSVNESDTWCSRNIGNLFAAGLVPFWSRHLLRSSSYYSSSRLKVPSRIKLAIAESVTWRFLEAESPWKLDATAVEIHNTNAPTERQRSKAIAAILNFCHWPSRGNVWKGIAPSLHRHTSFPHLHSLPSILQNILGDLKTKKLLFVASTIFRKKIAPPKK